MAPPTRRAASVRASSRLASQKSPTTPEKTASSPRPAASPTASTGSAASLPVAKRRAARQLTRAEITQDASEPKKATSASPSKSKLALSSLLELDNEESGSESSSADSSSEEEDEDEGEIEVKKPTKAGRGKGKQTHAHLLEKLSDSKSASAAALAWTRQAKSNQFNACVELAAMLVEASGGDSSIVSELAAKIKDEDDVFAQIYTRAYETISKRVINKLPKGWSVFWSVVGKEADAEPGAMVIELTREASLAPSKALRQLGVSAGMRVGLGQLERSLSLRDSLTKSRTLLATEVKKCVAAAKKPAVADQLRTKTDELENSLDAALAQPAVDAKSRLSLGTGASAQSSKTSKSKRAGVKGEAPDMILEAVHEALENWRDVGRDGLWSAAALRSASDCVKSLADLRKYEASSLEDIFHSIGARGFRDLEASVREESAKAMGEWSRSFPEAMSTSARSKFLGWFLFDKSAAVRREALEAISILSNGVSVIFKEALATRERELSEGTIVNAEELLAVTSRLTSFVARFSPRLRTLLRDVDCRVVAAALRLTKRWVSDELLIASDDGEDDSTQELLQEACERVFFEGDDHDAKAVRMEAAGLVRLLRKDLAPLVDESDEIVLRRNRVVALGEYLVDTLCVRKSDEDEVFDEAFAMIPLAVDAFWELESESGGLLVDWEALIDVLSGQITRTIGSNKQELLLTRAIAVVFSTSVRRTLQRDDEEDDIEETEREAADMIMKKASNLAIKLRSDPFSLRHFLLLLPLALSAQSSSSITNVNHSKLLDELLATITEKSDDELLQAAVGALAAMCTTVVDGDGTLSGQAKEVAARCVSAVGSGLDAALSRSASELELVLWSSRAAALSCGLSPETDRNVDSEHSFLLNLSEAAREASAFVRDGKAFESDDASSFVANILRALLGAGAWAVLKASDSASSNSEDVVRARNARDATVDLFERIFLNVPFSLSDAEKTDTFNEAAPVAGRALLTVAVGAFNDARTIFWPGNEGFGWVPSSSSIEFAGKFTRLIVNSIRHRLALARRSAASESNNEEALETLAQAQYEAHAGLAEATRLLVAPAVRAALTGSARVDLESGAHVLCLLVPPAIVGDSSPVEDETALDDDPVRAAVEAYGVEARRLDVDRALQTHVEALRMEMIRTGGQETPMLLAEALTEGLPKSVRAFNVASIGPKSQNAFALAQGVSRAVARALRRGLNLALLPQESAPTTPGLLAVLVPYLNWCDEERTQSLVEAWGEALGKAKAARPDFAQAWDAQDPSSVVFEMSFAEALGIPARAKRKDAPSTPKSGTRPTTTSASKRVKSGPASSKRQAESWLADAATPSPVRPVKKTKTGTAPEYEFEAGPSASRRPAKPLTLVTKGTRSSARKKKAAEDIASSSSSSDDSSEEEESEEDEE